MDHDLATRENLTERYLLEELDAESRDNFEAHYFSCPVCAEDVRMGAAFVDALKAVLRDESALPKVARKNLARYGLLDWLRFPAFAPYAVAAMMSFVVLYQSSVTIPGLRMSEPQILASVVLHPATRGSVQTIVIPPKDKTFQISADVNASGEFSSLRCSFRNATGETVVELTTRKTERDAVNFLLPTGLFPPGTYSLTIAGLTDLGEKSDYHEIEKYRFKVTR